MSSMKIFITLEPETVRRVDALIAQRSFLNRSHVVETAVREKLDRLAEGRLARECAKLDPVEEKALAEEGFFSDMAPRWGC
jgi:Arc/MetJ-type ribon-helix-helix transcriptional regulator